MTLIQTEAPKKRKGVIRRAIMAPPGYVVVGGDSSQVEARTLAWKAEEAWLVDAFKNERDVYSEFATEAYGKPITKEANPDERFIGKICVLALGYGMGFIKLATTIAAGTQGPAHIFTEAEAESMGVNVAKFASDLEKISRVESMPSRLPMDKRIVHCAVADHLVRLYRNKNKQIGNYWKMCEEVIGCMADMAEDAPPLPFGPVQIKRHAIVLPSGLQLKYRDLKYDSDGASYYDPRMKSRTKLYGGKLTENIIQAVSRCIISDQMLAIADAGYRPVTMTHDEIVLCVPEHLAKDVTVLLLQIMRTPPDWAEGLPLDAEAGWHQRYGDIKKKNLKKVLAL